MPEATRGLDLPLAESAADSRDSALQYLAIDLAEAGLTPDEQEDVLGVVEAEMREHRRDVLRKGLAKAFAKSPDYAAQWVVEEFPRRLRLKQVPREYREAIEEAVETRLHQKQMQLADLYSGLVADVMQAGVASPEGTLFEWEAVV